MTKKELEKLVKKQKRQITDLNIALDAARDLADCLDCSNRLLHKRIDNINISMNKKVLELENSQAFNIKKCQRYSDKLKIVTDQNMALMAQIDMQNNRDMESKDEIPF